MTGSILEGVRVHLVDDDEDAAVLLGLCLEKEGAKVDRTATARAALERLSHEPADVLVADLGLGDEDGLWLIQQLGGAAGGIKLACIALSGNAEASTRAAAQAAGYDRFLGKPVDRVALIAEIAALHTSRRTNDEGPPKPSRGPGSPD